MSKEHVLSHLYPGQSQGSQYPPLLHCTPSLFLHVDYGVCVQWGRRAKGVGQGLRAIGRGPGTGIGWGRKTGIQPKGFS